MLPDAGLGVAVKIDDGASRGAETAIAALLEKLGVVDGGAGLSRASIINTRGDMVGEKRPAKVLLDARL
jgi:L-asparaginase II